MWPLRCTFVTSRLLRGSWRGPLFNSQVNGVADRRGLSSTSPYDVVIVGGGIVGLATARELIGRHPNLKFAVVEKESELSRHQSGHNSGVIHCGIYYQPGSLKAKLCIEGMELSYKYCDENNIPYKKLGKLIVAVEDYEIPNLEALYKRGLENGCKDLKMIKGDEIKEYEPNCKGVAAIVSPHTGIVDWAEVTRSYGTNFQRAGGDIFTDYEVTNFRVTRESPKENLQGGMDYPVTVQPAGADKPPLHCKYVVTCGGLYSDRLAEKSGCSREPRILPFRGEYLLLPKEFGNIVRGNIYPVPDPRFPFLGVHFTPRMDGSVWLGPNAVLAFAREGYGYFDINLRDMVDALSHRGLQRLVWKYFAFGLGEYYRGIFTRAQVKQLQRYIPSLNPKHVQRGSSGVRAQALSTDGELVDDFVFDGGEGEIGSRVLHVRNAPSPAATSSLAIGKMIADKIQDSFHL